jgi:ligand-binding sensor domain-containing protein
MRFTGSWRHHLAACLMLSAHLAIAAAPAASLDLVRPEPLDQTRIMSIAAGAAMIDGVVTSVVQDPSGFIWAGTTAGLLRYDGYRLRAYVVGDDGKQNLGTSFVNVLLPAKDGRLWIGTGQNGLFLFDPARNLWSRFLQQPAELQAANSVNVRALAHDPDGSLWVGTAGGLHHISADQARIDAIKLGAGSADNRVEALLVDAAGTVWSGSWNGLQRRARGGQFAPVLADGGSARLLAGKVVTMLGQAQDGRIWVGTQQGDLLVLDASGHLAQAAPADGGSSAVYAMTAGEPGQVWVARGDGLERRAAADARLLQHIGHAQDKPWALANADLRALLRDKAGALWLGSYGGGLQMFTPFSPGLWVRRPDGEAQSILAESDVRSVLQLAGGEIWVGTAGRGVAVLDPQLRVRADIRPGKGFEPGVVGGLAQTRDGHVWVGSEQGLHEFSPQRQPIGHYAIGNGRARRLLAGADGKLWVAALNGLFVHVPGEAEIRPVLLTDGTRLSSSMSALTEDDKGNLWCGGDGGIFRVGAGELRAQLLQAPADPERDPNGATPVVTGMLFAHQTLWVDTARGLHRLRMQGGQHARLERVTGTFDPGFKSFGANLLEDARGRIWTQRAVFDPAKGDYYQLSQADGVDIGPDWFRAYTKLADGRMLFGGKKGLLMVDPARFGPWLYEPPLVATELRIDGVPQPLASAREQLLLQPGQRGFSLEFAALDFSDPLRNQYRYQLKGFDRDWIDTRADLRVASYSNLDPGDYVLQVRGSNRAGVWSAQTLTIGVRVLPAWYQSWWFKLVLASLVLASGYAILRTRTAMLKQRQRVLEGQVAQQTERLVEANRDLSGANAELQVSNDTLRQLGEVGRDVTNEMSIDSVFESLYRHADGLLDASLFSIFRLSDDHLQLELVFGVADGQPLAARVIAFDCATAIGAQVARERREIVLEFSPGRESAAPADAADMLSVIYAPLVIDDHLLGVMTVQTRRAYAYGERERMIFRSLCSYGAIALAMRARRSAA